MKNEIVGTHTNMTWTTRLAYGFLTLLGLLILLVMLVLSPVGVSTLVSFVNDQEGISLKGVEGSFYTQLSTQQITVDNKNVFVQIDEGKVSLSFSCIFSLELCLDSLHAKQVKVQLQQPSKAPSDAKLPLNNYFALPVKVAIKDIRVGQFHLDQVGTDGNQEILKINAIEASAKAHNAFTLSQVSIDDIHVYRALNTPIKEHNQVHVTWLEAIQSWQYSPIVLPEIFIPVNAEIRKASINNICVVSLPINAAETNNDTQNAAELCTQNTQLKASVKKQAITLIVKTAPTNTQASLIDIKLTMNLATSFEHDLNMFIAPNHNLVDAKAKPLQLSATGNIDGSVLNIFENQIRLANITLESDVTSSHLPMQVKAELVQLSRIVSAWFPDVYVPIDTLNVSVKGNVKEYLLDITSRIISPNTSLFSVQASVFLSEKQLVVDKIMTSGDLGHFEASSVHKIENQRGMLALANAVTIDFNDFQIKPLLNKPQNLQKNTDINETASLSTSLNGRLDVNALYTDKHISGTLLCKDIAGTVAQYHMSFLCDMELSPKGLLNVRAFSFKQGENTLSGKGKLNFLSALSLNALSSPVPEQKNIPFSKSSSDFHVTINAANLNTLQADLAGSIHGSLAVTGPVISPQVAANVKAKALQYGNVKIEDVSLIGEALLGKDWKTALDMHVKGLSTTQLLAKDIHAKVFGNVDQHDITLSLQHPEYGFSHNITGALSLADEHWSWLGKWEQGEWKLPFERLTLREPSAIRLSAKALSVQAHCWDPDTRKNDNAFSRGEQESDEICIDRAVYANSVSTVIAHINYNLTTPLVHYFPKVIMSATDIPLRSDISLSYDVNQGLEADIFNIITQSNVVTSQHNIALSAVVANMRLDQDVLNTHIFAGTQESGAIGLNSRLMLTPDNRYHEAELRIEQFQLAPLLRFIPAAEKLSGLVQGNVALSGLLEKPDVSGSLYVENGELILDNYPYPFSEFNQSINIVNNEANISGEFELGDGDAQYDAVLSFKDDIKASGNVRGAGMQIAYQNSELLLTPNIRFDVNPKKITVTGELSIPNAQIVIKELPKSAKSATSDTIIVGKPLAEPVVPIGLNVDLRLLLDAPKLGRVNIDALDLRASLAGDLQLKVLQQVNETNQQFGPLETYLNGSINVLSGRYEAYGQMLQIKSGDIYFSGAPSLPQFDISAIRNPLNTADQVIAGVRVSGNPVIPKVELFSEPSMIQARQLSYLLQGTDIDGGEGGANNVQLINALVNYGIGNSENRVNKIGQRLGFDSLNIQTAGQGSDAQVQVTGRISDKIQVTYGVGLFDPVSIVILKYQLLPKLYIEASSGVERAVDLFYEVARGEPVQAK